MAESHKHVHKDVQSGNSSASQSHPQMDQDDAAKAENAMQTAPAISSSSLPGSDRERVKMQ